MAGKNSQIHLHLETSICEKLKREAFCSNLSLSELCRQKLAPNHVLIRIENILESLLRYNKLVNILDPKQQTEH